MAAALPLAFLLVVLFGSALPAAAQQAPETRPAPAKAATKLDSRLVALATLPPGAQASTLTSHLIAANDKVAVTIRTQGPTTDLEARLHAGGALIANTAVDVLEAYVPLLALNGLERDPAVVKVTPIRRAVPRLVGEGSIVHNAASWNLNGYVGAGIKVGIIDEFRRIRSLLGTELPNAVIGRCYSAIGVFSSDLATCDRGADHGTAVAEALIDIAPAVTLYVSNPISLLDEHATIEWMVSQGVKVINYSNARVWDGPGDGTSPYPDSPLRAVDKAVAGGAVFVAAAGNEEGATWFGSFADGDGDRFMDYVPGTELNCVQLTAFETVILQLRWQDSWTAASKDFDLYLYDESLNVVAASVETQDGSSGAAPFEAIDYTALFSGRFCVAVDHYAGQLPAWLQLQAFSSQRLSTPTVGHGIANPAESSNSGLLATGAASHASPTIIESFSSRGPTPDGRVKPDLVGADRANSVIYGPNGFTGTSQASPHVAGLAALVRQAFPTFTPQQTADYLRSNALPRSSPRPNNVWGYGFAYLPALAAPTDVDSDGLPDSWELLYGLSPASAAGDNGAGGDIDADGVTNLAEFERETDPTLPNVWNLPEGATGFFTERIAVANPGTDTAAFTLTLLPESGSPTSVAYTLGARSRRTITVNELAGLSDAAVSAIVTTSRGGVVVERTMLWDGRNGSNYGGHTGKAIPQPRTTWYLAEGEASFFDTYILLANATNSAASVTLSFLLENGSTITHNRTVPANARVTVYANEVPGLRGNAFSTTITSSVAIAVERAMYFGNTIRLFNGGHGAAAVAAPARSWFVAEGRTGPFFDMYLLLGNPGTAATNATITFLVPSGMPVVRTWTLPPTSRTTIHVDSVPGLADTDVSAAIAAGEPIIVERAMYWPDPFTSWYEAHNSSGVTATGTRWALAEGEVGGALGFETYILLANPSSVAASVTLTFLRTAAAPITVTRTVPSNGRLTVSASEAALTSSEQFGVLIESSEPIAVERAMYWNGGGQFWGAGTNETGVRIR